MKVFFPIWHIDVPASPAHDSSTAYRVSFGVEHWGPEPTYVHKAQIVQDGAASGRRSPSFPAGADGFERVWQVMAELRRSCKDIRTPRRLAQSERPVVEEPTL